MLDPARPLPPGPAREIAPPRTPQGATAQPPGHVAWSASRKRLLETCERAYYWRYLGGRGGFKAPKGSDTWRAWALKHLTSLPLLLGTTVHQAARALLIANRDRMMVPTADQALAAARLTLRHVWITSTRHRDRFWSMPGVYTAFLEIIYRGALTERETASARERLAACIDALYTMPLLNDLAEAAPNEILISTGSPSWFLTAAGGVVWVDLDLAYWHRGDTPVGTFSGAIPCITDFKTGGPQPDSERVQLAAYALYLRDVLGWPPTDGVYLGRVIYLGHARERWVVIGADEIRAVEGLIAEDLVRMERLLLDPSLGTARAASAYAVTTDRAACARCPFLELCTPEIGRPEQWPRRRQPWN